jgi:hypothetical protein
MAGEKITLREVEALAHLLEHGRWPDAATAEWAEARLSKVALDYLLAVRLRGTLGTYVPGMDEGVSEDGHRGAA